MHVIWDAFVALLRMLTIVGCIILCGVYVYAWVQWRK